ncbi:MAG TPA: DNA methyltransferase [Rubricoccaceae bacterium]|jgi:SAM-dependent methyltransferase
MTPEQRVQTFVDYARTLKGDEKGEAQVFVDRLFQAFGHGGVTEAGATLEERVKRKGKATGFADLHWEGRVLIEMKKRGERLSKHYDQAREYWFELAPRPPFVILSNFDEFWIYNFELQHDPVDKVRLDDLVERRAAFNFLLRKPTNPEFTNDRVAVTRRVAETLAALYTTLLARRADEDAARTFMLRSVVAMFAEDTGLLPKRRFLDLLEAAETDGTDAGDAIAGLFRQMATPTPAASGPYAGVRYFNGGLFRDVEPFSLLKGEAFQLAEAARRGWNAVQPEVLGTLFQSIMDPAKRHASGAHFTHEADIQKIVQPTIVRPWRERIAAARTLTDLVGLRDALLQFRVLDPACGSGNFLYVAFRELKRLEIEILARIAGEFSVRERQRRGVNMTSRVNVRQLYGLDNSPFGVELARVTLTIAKELAQREALDTADADEADLTGLLFSDTLPLDDLAGNIREADALFTDWPAADAVIGNPPFQSKNKMQTEFGPAYVRQLREAYPALSGRADYCVYWIRKTHDHLAPGGRAGLVGTNTIRQNESREGGLDYVVQNGGTITEAVSTQPWTGEAAVHVSIVNWVKGEAPGMKRLYEQKGNKPSAPTTVHEVEHINPALSPDTDVTGARALAINAQSGACYQGQTHGHAGFLLPPDDARRMIEKRAANADVVHPFMTGDDLLSEVPPGPARYVVDFQNRDLFEAQAYREPFEHIRRLVLPTMEANAAAEHESTGRDKGPRQQHLQRWWRHWRGRGELMAKLDALPRYIACSNTTMRSIFAFVSSTVHPNAKLQVFPLADDYSFGILQSGLHWDWFVARCTTLGVTPSYTSNTVFDSFPWPQAPTAAQARAVADAAVALRALRDGLVTTRSLREVYRLLDTPGANPLRTAHDRLDAAVRAAYGMPAPADALAHLLALNADLADREAAGQPVVGPGLPPAVTDPAPFLTTDAVGPRAQPA